jgi:hypothetical protein
MFSIRAAAQSAENLVTSRAMRLGAAALIASSVAATQAAAATLTPTGTANSTYTSLPGNFDFNLPDLHPGTLITVFDSTHAGGLLVAPNHVDITFEYIGKEAAWTNTTFTFGIGTALFNTSIGSNPSQSFTYDLGNPAYVPFYFQTNNGNNASTPKAATNGGTIDSTLAIAFACVSSNVCYAMFDDGGGGPSPGDRDFDDMVIRITAVSHMPLPAALPLFAGGLGVLGLVVRRRKKKIAAARV